jgi:hypothetical protein
MAKTMDWDQFYKMAQRNIRPTYRKLSRMDSNDWLATVGLERRNVAADIFAASGFVLLGCAVGVGLGLLLAPKPGTELRADLNKTIRNTAERVGITDEHAYAS